MRLGALVGSLGAAPSTFDDQLAATRAAVAEGYDSLWAGQLFGWDPLTLLTAIGPEARGLELGTAIVPTWPRHPFLLAAQALSAQAALGGRLTLGIGPSHQAIVEATYGVVWERPLRHVAEFLEVLVPALHGEPVDVDGETVVARGTVTVAGAEPPGLLLSALGPRMLELAGAWTDGTATAWAGPRLIADRIAPAISAAASAAGRAAPRIVASTIVQVTSDVNEARDALDRDFAAAATLPSYRAVFDQQQISAPSGACVIGDEDAVLRELRAYEQAGATDLIVIPAGPPTDQARTRALLNELARG